VDNTTKINVDVLYPDFMIEKIPFVEKSVRFISQCHISFPSSLHCL